MTREQKIGIMCNIGEEILQLLQDEGYFPYEILEDLYKGGVYFKPEAQELFDKIYDILDNNIPDNE